ncbi:MAG: glycosyltransferase family 4 protein [Polyangiaceae bacterium]
MRVLFLSPVGNLGGAERSLMDLAASMRAHSSAIELGLLLGGDGPLVDRASALGMRVFHESFGDRLAQLGDSELLAQGPRAVAATCNVALGAAVDAAKYIQRLDAVIREFEPSVVHSNGIKMHLVAAMARNRVPLIWHIRDFIGGRPVVSRAMALCASRADEAIAISNAVAKDARRVLPRVRSTVIHNAIDTSVFSPHGATAKLDALARLEEPPPGTVRVGLVATYARWKGHDLFLRAARLAKAQVPNVRFYVVGGPIYAALASQFAEDELRTLSETLGLNGSVAFVPFQERVEEVYRALDVVVHTSSRPEPFGRAIAEAMATGRAVLASREGGSAELFSDGFDAVGVTPRDEVALAESIARLVVDPNRRAQLGERARASAVRRFSRERLASDVLRVYSRAGCC